MPAFLVNTRSIQCWSLSSFGPRYCIRTLTPYVSTSIRRFSLAFSYIFNKKSSPCRTHIFLLELDMFSRRKNITINEKPLSINGINFLRIKYHSHFKKIKNIFKNMSFNFKENVFCFVRNKICSINFKVRESTLMFQKYFLPFNNTFLVKCNTLNSIVSFNF